MIIDAGEVPGEGARGKHLGSTARCCKSPRLRGVGRFSTKGTLQEAQRFCKARRGGERSVTWPRSTPAGPPKSSGLHGPEPLDRVTMEIVLGRTRAKHEPGTSSSAAERAGAGPGAAPLPGPARSFFALGRAAPPRPAPPPPPPSSPRASRALAARSRQPKRELAATGLGGEWRCFPAARLGFKETDASRGSKGPWPGGESRSSPKVPAGAQDSPSPLGEQSFLRRWPLRIA